MATPHDRGIRTLFPSDRAKLEPLIVTLKPHILKTLPPQFGEDVFAILSLKMCDKPEKWLKLSAGAVVPYAIRSAVNLVYDFSRAGIREAAALGEYRRAVESHYKCASRGMIHVTEPDLSDFSAQTTAVLRKGAGRRLGCELLRASRSFGCTTRLDQADFAMAYVSGPMPARFGTTHPKVTRWIVEHVGMKPRSIQYESTRLAPRLALVRHRWKAKLRRDL